MAYSEPTSWNTYVPTAEATAYMVSGFGRDIKSFPINRYLEIRPVTKTMGYYLRWKSEQAARIRYGNLADMVWPDGAERPRGQDNLELFEFEPYKTERYAPAFTLGQRTLDQADWPLHEYTTKQIAEQMMTGRSVLASNFLQTTNWYTNTANVDGTYGSIGANPAILSAGQNWTNGTSTSPNIKKSFEYILNIIRLVTLGAVEGEDIACVISPNTAIPMSQSPEVNDVMARSIYAMPNLTGELWYNKRYALPDELYGVRLIIDDTVQVTNGKLVAPAPLSAYGYTIPTGQAYFLTAPQGRTKDGKLTANVRKNMRPGDDGNERNAANYFPVLATLVMFAFEELTIEAMSFPFDRLIQGSVVSDFDIELSSWKGGFAALKCLG